ncbi:MAG: EF-hand domain-containing protein [Sulfuricella denitrificans]|nr:EF-hand domain-containing protein [Sulfuricella denitrificans]
MQRPDPSQMASKLFSKLDSKNQGYIEKSDLQSAFDQISGSSSSSSSVDDIFSQLDNNSDGKITKQEMSDSLTRLSEQLDSQFNSMRMNGKGGMHNMGEMPPPPPQGADSAGLTKDQLTSMANEAGSANSKLTSLASNFDKADTNGDGKVSMQEAMAYEQSNQTRTASTTSTGSGSDNEASVMKKIMQLAHAYGVLGQDSNQNTSTGTFSVSA